MKKESLQKNVTHITYKTVLFSYAFLSASSDSLRLHILEISYLSPSYFTLDRTSIKSTLKIILLHQFCGLWERIDALLKS